VKHRTIAGKEHQLVVLKVTSRDERGRPKTCDVGFDDTTFKLEQNDHFITCWVPVGVERTAS
jgi:hypothetical protein